MAGMGGRRKREMEEKTEKGGGEKEERVERNREEGRQGVISPWDPWQVKLLKYGYNLC